MGLGIVKRLLFILILFPIIADAAVIQMMVCTSKSFWGRGIFYTRHVLRTHAYTKYTGVSPGMQEIFNADQKSIAFVSWGERDSGPHRMSANGKVIFQTNDANIMGKTIYNGCRVINQQIRSVDVTE